MHETIKHSADLRTISSFKLQPAIVYQRHSQKGQKIETPRGKQRRVGKRQAKAERLYRGSKQRDIARAVALICWAIAEGRERERERERRLIKCVWLCKPSLPGFRWVCKGYRSAAPGSFKIEGTTLFGFLIGIINVLKIDLYIINAQ